LSLLFASFGLFAPRNLTSAVTLTLCAVAVAGAIGMILELERGFGGVVHISPQPMRQAANTLKHELEAEDYEMSAFATKRIITIDSKAVAASLMLAMGQTRKGHLRPVRQRLSAVPRKADFLSE